MFVNIHTLFFFVKIQVWGFLPPPLGKIIALNLTWDCADLQSTGTSANVCLSEEGKEGKEDL